MPDGMKRDYTLLPIGTDTKPWPTILPTNKGGVPDFTLGAIRSDNPLWLLSQRAYGDAVPEMYRNMPVPGMLPAFEAIVNNPLVYLESDPGYGKTFLGYYVGHAMHPQGAIMADMGGKNLESLLYETVFDADISKNLVDRINRALAQGTMTEPALKALRELTVEQEDGQKVSLLSEEGDKKTFDWTALSESSIPRERIDSTFDSIKRYQEWNGSMHIGFKEIEGPLIRAAKEHRPLVIDEVARRKPGSEAALQQVWPVISGDIPEITIPLGNLGHFTLKHGDIPRTIMTSNKLKDGRDVHPFSDSFWSRLKKVEIPAFSQQDWAHRISQLLSGVPITTLARLEEGKMEHGANRDDARWKVADEKRFTRNLHSIHSTGNPAATPLQHLLIDHWPEVVNVSQALATAYHLSSKWLDPDSPEMQKPDMGALRNEIETPGDPARKVTPRDAVHLLQQAIVRTVEKEALGDSNPSSPDFTDWSMPIIRPSNVPLEAELGKRIKHLIQQWIFDVAGVSESGILRPKLFKQLTKTWEKVLADPSVLDGLNIVEKSNDILSDETIAAKTIIDRLLRMKYEGFEGVPPQHVELFLKSMQDHSVSIAGPDTWRTEILTTDPDTIQQGTLTAPTLVVARSTKEDNTIRQFMTTHPPAMLVEQESVVATLGLPVLGNKMLQALSIHPDDLKPSFIPPAASFGTKVPVMTTTAVAATADGQYAKIHIVHNKKDGATLVVASQPLAGDWSQSKNITVVSAADAGALASVDAWLKAHSSGQQDALKQAFAFRNDVPAEQARDSLADLLINPAVKAFSPTMVRREAVQSASR